MRMPHQIKSAIRTLQAVTDNPHLFPADLVSTCEIARQALLWVAVDSQPASAPAKTKFYQLVLGLRKTLESNGIKEPSDVI